MGVGVVSDLGKVGYGAEKYILLASTLVAAERGSSRGRRIAREFRGGWLAAEGSD